MREIKAFPLLEDIRPKDRQRENIHFIQFVLVFPLTNGSIPKIYPVHDPPLTNEWLMWQQKQMRLHEADEQTSRDMFRRKLKTLNRNMLILFVYPLFGIFHPHEVFILAVFLISELDCAKEYPRPPRKPVLYFHSPANAPRCRSPRGRQPMH